MHHRPLSSDSRVVRRALVLLVLFAICCATPGASRAHPVSVTQRPTDSASCPAYDASAWPAALPAPETPAAGSLPGTFSVSPAGQATYRIPIAVPPGRLGMEPALAVGYDSSAGDGPLGVGFSLQGISAIRRCPSNLAQDGTIAPVVYDITDHFCLDGLRLVPVTPSPGDAPGFVEYRTFPDTFSKIVAYDPGGGGGPHSFEVFTKAGHVLKYGGADNANSWEMASGGAIAAWWLATEEDRLGNAVDYTYLNDAYPDGGQTLEMLPLRIDYTRNGSTAASHAVVFEYQGVTPSWLYDGGLAHTRSRLLRDIQTRMEPGDTVVRWYAFDYAPGPGSQRNVLQSVTECAGLAGPCNPPTTFSWSGQPARFTKLMTPPLVGKGWTSTVEDDARWVLADVNGDGLDDLVMVTHLGQNTDLWVVALNVGGFFGAPELWATLPHPTSAGTIPEVWTLTPVDYDQDGRTDIFIDSPNPTLKTMPQYYWLRSVPDGPPGKKLELHATGIAHPNGVYYDPSYDLPAKVAAHRFARLGDVNGDGIADLIQCFNPTWSEGGYHPSLGNPQWTVNLWVPSVPGTSAPGFDPTPIPITAFDGLDCAAGFNEVYVVDIDGDGVSEIIAPQVDQFFGAFRYENGGWIQIQTNLALPVSPRFVHFLDLNGDGLTDALYSGYLYNCDSTQGCPAPTFSYEGSPADVPFQAINSGKTFSVPHQDLHKSLFPPASLPGAVGAPSWAGATDWWGDQAIALDYNGDGRMDLVMPISSHCTGSKPTDPPCWVILQTNPGIAGHFSPISTVPATDFATPIDTGIGTVFDQNDNLAPWFLPQVTDVDGNGTHDLVVPNPVNDGSFFIYLNTGAQDMLVGVTDGMNPLDPKDAGFVPTVSIQYGNLVDAAITKGLAESSAAAEPLTYLSRFDPGNDCQYPRACVVGTEHVVKSFQRNDGQNQTRSFGVSYRDGRYHRLGRGNLGFGERILFDDQAGSGSAELYDNTTWDGTFNVFPFAGQVVDAVAWSPTSATQPAPTQIELSWTSATLQQIFTDGRQIVPSGAATYFTLPVVVQRTRQEGTFQAGQGQTLLQWVAATEAKPAFVLSHVTDTVSSYDGYGNVLAQDRLVDGVDLHDTLTRQVENDPASWLVGLVRSEQACSSTSVAGKQCRTTKRWYNTWGEVTSASLGDPTDPGTKLSLEYYYDAFGNVTRTTAADAFGHFRAACTSYEPQGIFPYASANTLGHVVRTAYDPAFGVMTVAVDVNGLVTQRAYDGFGRVAEEVRPDETWTMFTVTRTKDGGPQGNWWNRKISTQDAGGAIGTTELDGAGRPVHTWARAAAVTSCGESICASTPTIEQATQYDLFGRVVRVTRPWLSGDALLGKYADTYVYDAAGRVTSHTEPWGRVTTYGYAVGITSATDWLGKSLTEVDPLGRTVVTSDKNGGGTSITYGPFSETARVTRFGAETTSTDRDAYGRMLHEHDPDRGETVVTYDGFGEPLNMADTLGRTHFFTYDGIGRLVQRDDLDSSGTATTTWTFDTALHGVGRVAVVTSPANHVDTYTYDALSRPSTHTLTLGDTQETFGSTLDYDYLGRPWHIGYPTATGVTPLLVRREYDAYGRLVALHDDGAKQTFWQLQRLDGAGRATEEALGNGVSVQHTYLPASGLVQQIAAGTSRPGWPPTTLQDLSYTYDAGLRMTSRRDGLQPGWFDGVTESFSHDALDRLTCASVSSGISLLGAPCDNPIEYQANGNISIKDGSTYGYDPNHPHAVATAGSSSFSYDAVGNQIARPGVPVITYTPFDLPSIYTLAAGTVTLDYDGDQRRIRKTTAAEETVYFDGMYERVSNVSNATQVHRYYVAAGSSTVVLTRAVGATDEVAYLLTEALGSVDVVTDGGAGVLQPRSYDAFGARRDPAWVQSQSTFTSAVSPIGFTGHEGDDELGLVNMRGRIYDPKVARFLTTDPLVTQPGFSQSWNPYSYVWNSPLSFTDPSGFAPGDLEGEDGKIYAKLPDLQVRAGEGYQIARALAAPVAKDAARDDVPAGAPAAAPAGAPPAAGASSFVDTAVDVAKGVTTGVNRYLYPNPVDYVKAATGLTLGGNIRKGAHDDGVVGAVAGGVNTVNPLYHFGVAAVNVDQNAKAGNTKEAVAGATTLVLSTAAAIVSGVSGSAGAGPKGTVDLYRAVGTREFAAVSGSGKFLPGANSLEGRQFAFTLDEALEYAANDPSKVAVLKATIDRNALPAFDFSKAIDPHIFTNGVVTVQPGAQSDIFHAALQAIEHVF